ncbi:MAG: hypothetical protein KF823_05005 [Xanthomonadales bacterium]|nr:hypothetical protein [Xanthomonadales bacterium]
MTQANRLFVRLRDGAHELLGQFRSYFGLGGKVRPEPITDTDALRAFVSSRASFIAQTSLYGYLRTRAGQRYPDLFESDPFLVSINLAKWHMFLACLSDLSVYAGGLIARRTALSPEQVRELMLALLDRTLDETGHPTDADAEFPEHARRVRTRIALTDWRRVADDEDCFQASPEALVRWAPVVKEFMQLDESIVRNSVRFHWQEVRGDLRKHLDAHSIAAALG